MQYAYLFWVNALNWFSLYPN